jgi:hypothetical protein
VAATFTGTLGNGVNANSAKVYVNGISRGSHTYGTWAPDTVSLSYTFIGSNTFNGQLDDVRIYNWALSAAEVVALYNWAGTQNQPPLANAGPDTTIIQPASSVTLAGSGSDPDGSVKSYGWSQVSGPNTASFSTPSQATTDATGLIVGGYVFRLTVTDNEDVQTTDDVSVIVLSDNPSSLDSGLVGYWKFDEGSGTQANDASGNGNTGTVNGATWTTGVFNNALDFNGTSDHVNAGQDASLSITGPVSVSLWVYPRTNNTDMVFMEGSDQYIFWVQSNNEVRFADVHGNYVDSPAGILTLNSWNHITAVFSGVTGNAVTTANAKIYLNGVSVGNQAGGTWGPVTTLPNPVFIGSGNGYNYFNGQVDEVRIYNRALNAAEVVMLADTTKPNLPPTANAGPNTTITIPPNSTTLNGSGNDPDGSIASYAWSQITGPNTAVFVSPGAAATGVTGLAEGTYVFELTVTDNDNAEAKDSVTITVKTALPPPTTAGRDSLLITVVREKHYEWTDQAYKPYAVWWVEDDQGELVKVLYVTHFSDTVAGVQPDCGISSFYFTLTYFYDRFGSQGCPYKTGEQCSVCPSCPHDYHLVDGITGCSEPSSTIDTTVLTRFWDLTDRDGNRITGGTYHLYYSAVFIDEEQPKMDKTFQVTVVLDTGRVETTVIAPADIGGTSTDTDFKVKTIRISYGGTDSLGTNQPPLAFAGNDTALVLPNNSLVLSGTASDPDGGVASTAWTQYAGPGTATIVSPNSLTTAVQNLVQGMYVFRLTVLDNQGAPKTSEVTVMVDSATGIGEPSLPIVRAAPGLVTADLNPVNRNVRISYFVPQWATGNNGELSVCTADGKKVETLVNVFPVPGVWAVEWNGQTATGHRAEPGVYLLRLQYGTTVFIRKIIYLK